MSVTMRVALAAMLLFAPLQASRVKISDVLKFKEEETNRTDREGLPLHRRVAAQISRWISPAEAASSKGQINAMQWSSHWRCHALFPDCKTEVNRLLTVFLTKYKLDFVNLGMFQNEEWVAPDNYGVLDFACGDPKGGADNIKFLYNSDKWQPGPNVASASAKNPEDVGRNTIFGCGEVNARGLADRVYAVMPFEMKGSGEKVIVAAGHFPHPPGASSSAAVSVGAATDNLLKDHIGAKIKTLQKAFKKMEGGSKVVVIADMNNDIGALDPIFDSPEQISAALAKMNEKTVGNINKMQNRLKTPEGAVMEGTVADNLSGSAGWKPEPTMTSADAWSYLGVKTPLKTATDPQGTCCADVPSMDATNHVRFPFAFDRILADFGSMNTVMPLDETENDFQKLYVGAFHMPIIAQIAY